MANSKPTPTLDRLSGLIEQALAARSDAATAWAKASGIASSRTSLDTAELAESFTVEAACHRALRDLARQCLHLWGTTAQDAFEVLARKADPASAANPEWRSARKLVDQRRAEERHAQRERQRTIEAGRVEAQRRTLEEQHQEQERHRRALRAVTRDLMKQNGGTMVTREAAEAELARREAA